MGYLESIDFQMHHLRENAVSCFSAKSNWNLSLSLSPFIHLSLSLSRISATMELYGTE